MRGLTNLFLYLRYFFEPNDKMVRHLAYDAAKKYFSLRPIRNVKTPYPRVVNYEQRRRDFIAFQRAFNNSYRHTYARDKLCQKF